MLSWGEKHWLPKSKRVQWSCLVLQYFMEGVSGNTNDKLLLLLQLFAGFDAALGLVLKSTLWSLNATVT